MPRKAPISATDAAKQAIAELPKPGKSRPRGKGITAKAAGERRIDPQDVDPAYLTGEAMFKRELFAQAYVAHGSIRKAAEAAGYSGSPHAIKVSGTRLMKEPWVIERIEAIRVDLLAELKITQRAVLAELSRIGFADMGDVLKDDGQIKPLSEIPADARRALTKYKVKTSISGEGENAYESTETEVAFAGKMDALEKLGKHAGLWGRESTDGNGINADEFARALGEGIARVISGKRTITHSP